MTNQEFSHSFFDIAKMDLQAAEVLYDNNLFLPALFCLQQGVEKTNKAMGLVYGYLLPEDLKRDIGHSHVEIHKKMIYCQLSQVQVIDDKKEESKEVLEIINKYVPVDPVTYIKSLEKSLHIKNDVQVLDNIVASDDDFMLKDIITFLDSINVQPEEKFEELRTALPNLLKKDTKDWLMPLVTELKSKFPQIDITEVDLFFNDEKNINELADVLFDYTIYLNKLLPAFIKIYTIGFITQQLAEKVRYADFTNGFNPVDGYTEKHQLVIHLPALHRLASGALNDLSYLMKEPSHN